MCHEESDTTLIDLLFLIKETVCVKNTKGVCLWRKIQQ